MRLPLPQFATKERHPDRIAEVIETATSEFLAQCLEPEDLSFPVMPPFGSWVKARMKSRKIKFTAWFITLRLARSTRCSRARALGLSLEELREEQPQIFAMLKTEFRVAIVGLKAAPERLNGHGASRGKIYQYLQAHTPQIHQAVYRCEPDEVIDFTVQLDFLRTLLGVANAPVDALTAAAIQRFISCGCAIELGWWKREGV